MRKNPSLRDRMHALADEGHPDADNLRKLGDEFDAATKALRDGTGTPQSMLGAWARARKAWCAASGEPLV